MAQSIISGHFFDAVTFDVEQKTAVSVRDGVLEYFGHELGLEPANKIFKVYRSPAQVARAAEKMAGLPLTDEHVEVGPKVKRSIGSVVSAEVIDFTDGEGAALAIKNRLEVKAENLPLLDKKRELSLGYEARLEPAIEYDFKQVDIVPHHLALVETGRCGSGCRFLDKSVKKESSEMDMAKMIEAVGKFTDEQKKEFLAKITDAPTAAQVVELLGKFKAEEIEEIKEQIQKLIDPAGKGEDDDKGKDEDKDEDDKERVKDSKKVKDSAALEARFADAVAKATAEQVASTLAIIDRARQFLPADYQFADKTGAQVMRDAIATQHPDARFDDAELSVAFKLLRQPEARPFADFGRGNMGKFAELKDKEW